MHFSISLPNALQGLEYSQIEVVIVLLPVESEVNLQHSSNLPLQGGRGKLEGLLESLAA